MADTPRLPFSLGALIGPGLIVAATGVGAGDLIPAARAGAAHGTTILWAIALGAVMKWALSEGLARWQLATGTTLIEGWATHLPRWANALFLAFLVLWAFTVGAALTNSCALAGQAFFPGMPLTFWGVVHALAALALAWLGSFRLFEQVMKAFIAIMFAVVLVCALLLQPPLLQVLSGLFVPRMPKADASLILALMGGVGGSVTLLSYGYWLREKGWIGRGVRRLVWLDLTAAYAATALFGIGLAIIASRLDNPLSGGSNPALELAAALEQALGPVGQWAFLFGFWAAVFSSMVGVWQGVPYLFADVLASWRLKPGEALAAVSTRSRTYRGFLLFLALAPLVTLWVGRPQAVVLAYAITGAFFIPYLASTLLYLNNRRSVVKDGRNGWRINALLGLTLAFFGWACWRQLASL
ncbi:MAG: Nramp family divalent metal transporter [Opitutales bacterium]